MVASFHATSLPFIQMVPVPGKAISAPYGDSSACCGIHEDTRSTMIAKTIPVQGLPIFVCFSDLRVVVMQGGYCVSPQNGHRSDRAWSGLRQCQQNRGCGDSRALRRL